VGTVTEIHDYLRLLYAKIGVPHCPICGKEISKLSTDEIVSRILDLATPPSKPHSSPLLRKERENQENPKSRDIQIEILSPVVRSRKGEYSALLLDMYRRGFSKAYINGKEYELDPKLKLNLARYKKHNIDIVIDSVAVNDKNISRIFEDAEKALKLSDGLIKIKFSKKGPTLNRTRSDLSEIIFNQKLSCPEHEIEFPEMEPRLFSFNSPYGACPSCEGLGTKKEIDPELVISDKNKTISEGAVIPWSYKKNNYYGAILRAVTNFYRIPDNMRIRDLSEKNYNLLVFGDKDPDDISVSLRSKTGTTWRFDIEWKGIVGFLQDRYFKTESDAVREGIEKYMSQNPCSVCSGSRYKPETLLVTVGGKNINEISVVSVAETLEFFDQLKLNEKEKLVASRILKEVQNRLGFLENVGLGYLTLARAAFSLAGGETQRIRLASQIGSQLVGVLYILDEPSVGLHSRDNAKLLETLLKLRDIGNTLIVIEHDEETMRAADYLVDIGLGAGRLGGEIVAAGTPEEVLKEKKSMTAKYLRKELAIEIPKFRRPVKNKKWLTVRGASQHNLKNITAEFPLKVLTCVTGVSGSGKSTLVEDILYKALSSKLMHSLDRPGRHKEIIGTQYLDKVIMIDQSPIGRTPRSNSATYTGLFTQIRELFAATKDAKVRGYLPGRFSFNVPPAGGGGRCDNCEGDGFLKIEMQFMPDIYLPCDVCKGKRYNRETLEVRYKGKNISEVLEMTVSDAAEFFQNFPEIFDKLNVLEEVGLGYIHLGQAATTLSGGEAQRIKLATELSRRATGDTMYILDEPTTGLHFDDIKKLLSVLNKLVDAGNTVVVIEHNLDVVKTADWIIDLGPEGGDAGGRVVVTGEPEEVIKYHKESYTAKYLREVLKK